MMCMYITHMYSKVPPTQKIASNRRVKQNALLGQRPHPSAQERPGRLTVINAPFDGKTEKLAISVQLQSSI